MEDYQKRVIEEADQLESKIHKLQNFMQMRSFEDLPIEEQFLLKDQLMHMTPYRDILGYRIKRFFRPKNPTTLDAEMKREDDYSNLPSGHYSPKPIESLRDIFEKCNKDCSDDIGCVIADFDACLGITDHLWKTRDIGDFISTKLDYADVFRFVERQMRCNKQQLEEDVSGIDDVSVF